jgi:hypothetical protein
MPWLPRRPDRRRTDPTSSSRVAVAPRRFARHGPYGAFAHRNQKLDGPNVADRIEQDLTSRARSARVRITLAEPATVPGSRTF